MTKRRGFIRNAGYKTHRRRRYNHPLNPLNPLNLHAAGVSLFQFIQYRPAALHDIFIGLFIIIGKPGVCHIPFFSCPVKKAGDFFIPVAVGEAGEVMDIFLVHGDDLVCPGVVLHGDQGGLSFRKGNAVGGKGPLGGRVYVMAHFLSGGGHGGNFKFPLKPSLPHQFLHYHFRHG